MGSTLSTAGKDQYVPVATTPMRIDPRSPGQARTPFPQWAAPVQNAGTINFFDPRSPMCNRTPLPPVVSATPAAPAIEPVSALKFEDVVEEPTQSSAADVAPEQPMVVDVAKRLSASSEASEGDFECKENDENDVHTIVVRMPNSEGPSKRPSLSDRRILTSITNARIPLPSSPSKTSIMVEKRASLSAGPAFPNSPRVRSLRV
eukprot:m.246474 g.246474  ORF g.246474 m.246474 type:complete len:204 (+) comp15049_c0_seq1:105-716(+)